MRQNTLSLVDSKEPIIKIRTQKLSLCRYVDFRIYKNENQRGSCYSCLDSTNLCMKNDYLKEMTDGAEHMTFKHYFAS